MFINTFWDSKMWLIFKSRLDLCFVLWRVKINYTRILIIFLGNFRQNWFCYFVVTEKRTTVDTWNFLQIFILLLNILTSFEVFISTRIFLFFFHPSEISIQNYSLGENTWKFNRKIRNMITIDNHKDKENYGVNIYIEYKRNRNHFDVSTNVVHAKKIFVGKQNFAYTYSWLLLAVMYDSWNWFHFPENEERNEPIIIFLKKREFERVYFLRIRTKYYCYFVFLEIEFSNSNMPELL